MLLAYRLEISKRRHGCRDSALLGHHARQRRVCGRALPPQGIGGQLSQRTADTALATHAE